MRHEDIKNILNNQNYIGKNITVCGWVKTIRKSKNVCFIEINDGTSLKNLQLVANAENLPLFEKCNTLSVGSSVAVNGELVKSLNNNQSVELNMRGFQVLGNCPTDYPIQKKKQNMEFLREIPHLRTRTNTFNAVFRVRSVSAK